MKGTLSPSKTIAIALALGAAISVTLARRPRVAERRDPPLDTRLTETTRARFAPLLFAGGFEVSCRAGLCTLETKFQGLGAFRDFAETAFQGRDPIWPGTFSLANARSFLGRRKAGADAPRRAVLLLGEKRAAPARLGDKVVSSAVRITAATEGRPDRLSDTKIWSVRRADGAPQDAPEETMQNASPSQYRQLVIPLRARDNPEGEPGGATWHAFVAVGGPDLGRQPTRCGLEQMDTSHPSGPVLVASSGPQTYDASFDIHAGSIELTLPDGVGTAETFVRCSVPPQGWIGKVVWHTSAEPSPPGARPAPGPYAANTER